jgi:hypothetical protein
LSWRASINGRARGARERGRKSRSPISKKKSSLKSSVVAPDELSSKSGWGKLSVYCKWLKCGSQTEFQTQFQKRLGLLNSVPKAVRAGAVERPRETAETLHTGPQPSRHVRRKGAALLSAQKSRPRAPSAPVRSTPS